MEYPVRLPAQLTPVLQGFRKHRGLTQHELAARLDLTQKTLSHLELNASKASVERLLSVLSALDLELVIRDKTAPDATSGQQGDW
jgi:HTH-type transcriptional regulator/antitoxin HipB